MSTTQALVAFKVAATFRCEYNEVVRPFDLDGNVWMTGTFKLQHLSEVAILFQHRDHCSPHLNMTGSARVADNVHPMLCPRQKNINPVWSSEETTLALVIASNQRHNHHLRLFALEIIHGSNTHGV